MRTDSSPVRGKAAAGYIRVSQVGARGGDTFLSPDLQRDRITAWATYRGYTITEWYVDLDVSGRRGVRRPEFERMMTDARAGRFHMVAVYRLTRFGRSVQDTAARYAELRDLGCGLVSVTEDIDSSTATGGLIQNILFALAEFESERIGEEWASVHANRRSRGLVHATRGIYGYHTHGATITSIDEEKAQTIRNIYTLRLAGTSWKGISDALAARGTPSPRGEERWGQTTLLGVIRNPTYAGLVKHGADLIPADHPAIVDRELWERVQALHPRSARLARYGAGLASGLVVCAGCGYHMARGGYGKRRVYRCTARRHSRACPSAAQISAPLLDEYLEAEFLRRVDPHRVRRPPRDRWQERRAVLERRISEANRAIDKLSDERYLVASLSAEEYDRQLARLVDRRDQARADLEHAAAPRPVVGWAEAWPRASVAARQQAIRAVVREVRVTAGRGAPAGRVRIVWTS